VTRTSVSDRSMTHFPFCPILASPPRLRVEILLFRSRRCRAIRRFRDRRATRATALCLRPSARTPPPISVLLKTKVKPQFDRTVTERSKSFFAVFQGFNRGQFQPCFLVFTVRSAEGRRAAMLMWHRRGPRNAPVLRVLGWTAALGSSRRGSQACDAHVAPPPSAVFGRKFPNPRVG
jgi:hypothetical protein